MWLSAVGWCAQNAEESRGGFILCEPVPVHACIFLTGRDLGATKAGVYYDTAPGRQECRYRHLELETVGSGPFYQTVARCLRRIKKPARAREFFTHKPHSNGHNQNEPDQPPSAPPCWRRDQEQHWPRTNGVSIHCSIGWNAFRVRGGWKYYCCCRWLSRWAAEAIGLDARKALWVPAVARGKEEDAHVPHITRWRGGAQSSNSLDV